MTAPLPSRYGDDFTGSTDGLEALASRGIHAVRFTRLPPNAERAAFPHARAIGLAGDGRRRPTEWIDTRFPAIFAQRRGLGAGWSHHTVCSTLDSAPHPGLIGRAPDLGLAAFGKRSAVVLVGAPQLRRRTSQGHRFAAYPGANHRIERHPTMGRRPAKPMAESDLLVHPSRQADAPLALLVAGGQRMQTRPQGSQTPPRARR
ncbi:MAG: hypothetical protein ACI9ZH_000032 [Paracoccaceae bacterium]|jgi:uncharacterized protein YgbK (DUF1537 family)